MQSRAISILNLNSVVLIGIKQRDRSYILSGVRELQLLLQRLRNHVEHELVLSEKIESETTLLLTSEIPFNFYIKERGYSSLCNFMIQTWPPSNMVLFKYTA